MFVIVNGILMFSLSLVNRQSSPCRRQLGLPRSPTITCVCSTVWWGRPLVLGFCSWVELASRRPSFNQVVLQWDQRSLAVRGNYVGGHKDSQRAPQSVFLILWHFSALWHFLYLYNSTWVKDLSIALILASMRRCTILVTWWDIGVSNSYQVFIEYRST